MIRHRTSPRPWTPPQEDKDFLRKLQYAVYCGPFVVGSTAPYWNCGCYWVQDHTYCDYDPRYGEVWPEPMPLVDFLAANFRRPSTGTHAVTSGVDDDGDDMEAFEEWRSEVVERWFLKPPLKAIKFTTGSTDSQTISEVQSGSGSGSRV